MQQPYQLLAAGAVFESSHVPLHKWLQTTFLMCASKKGISAHQIHRTLEVTYKTARGDARWLSEPAGRRGEVRRGRRDLHRPRVIGDGRNRTWLTSAHT
jgi:hypothetical protein